MVASSKEFSERFSFITDYIAPEEVESLLQHMQVRKVDENEVIIHDNQPSSSLFFVWSGSLLSYIEDDGEIIQIGKIKPGQYIGEISFLDEGPATTSVKALEPCTLFTLSREDFAGLEKNYPNISSKLMRSISNLIISRLRSSDSLLFDGMSDENSESIEHSDLADMRSWLINVYESLHRH